MRCSMCGHESPLGSSFCLNCGSSLAPAFVQTPPAAAGLPHTCAVCRGENPPGMKFCRNCGSALPTAAPPPGPPGMAGPPPGPGMLPPPGAGAPLSGAAGFAPTMASPSMGAPGLGAAPTGPAPLVPGPFPMPADPGRAPMAAGSAIACPRCGTAAQPGFAFCQQCGFSLQGLAPTDPGPRVRPPSVAPPLGRAPVGGGAGAPAIDPQAATLASDAVRAGSISAPHGAPHGAPHSAPHGAPHLGAPHAHAGPAWGTAVLVNRDGSDGPRFALAGEYVVIGRAGADIAFDDDRFLGRQHARIERAADGIRVVPLEPLNGVFRKADAPVELVDGSTILVGREVLRFERVDPEEAKIQPLVRHGVALFGSPPREPWGRLVQVVPNGGVRDVRHLAADEVVLGREEGDIVFRDDAFLSRRHAAVTWDGKRARITDLGSSNGTFVRVTGPTPLLHGDHVRMGDQLLRIELGR